MNDTVLWIVSLSVAYLLGSIPFGYLLVRFTSGADIRETGSGNIGATNVARSGSKGLAVATLVLDALKGFLAVSIAQHLALHYAAFPKGYDVAALAGLFAVIGHIFPIWLGFRGGKGVATALGVFFALTPMTALAIIVIFAAVFALTRYVSLASLVAAVCYPIIAILSDGKHRLVVDLVYIAIPVLVILKHSGNIGRLRAGTEPKFGTHQSRLTSHTQDHRMSRIAVLGAGAWGTALALSLARQNRHDVTLWAHSPDHAEELQATRNNRRYLPGFALPEDVAITSSLADAADRAEILLSVTPSSAVPETVAALAPHIGARHVFVSASKGIQDGTHRRMSEVVAAASAVRFAVLGGPSFAKEVAGSLPTAVTLGCADAGLAAALQRDFSSDSLRVYTNDDVIGVELGGALKNVIALAAGVVAGLELGSNAAAALITRGMAEITRLSVACGAQAETMAGLAGYGDLVLTCTGSLSRNRTVGVELGRGRKLADILASLNGKVAEGVRCTTTARGLAAQHGVEMPITDQMFAILHEDLAPREAIRLLMTRPGRNESAT